MIIVNNINFREDMNNICRHKLEEKGYDLTGVTNEHDLPIVFYFTAMLRLIQPRQRRIEKATGFSCPTELEAGLLRFEEKLRNGEDLLPNMSKTLTKVEFQDKMLYAWHIHHFHLGTTIESDHFVSRTGDVLYAIIKDDCAYFIKIMPHGHWSDKELLEIVHQNWPKIIEKYKKEGEPRVSLGSHDIKVLRKGSINTVVTMDDHTVYSGNTYGFTISGDSLEARSNTNKLISCIRKLEKATKQHFADENFNSIDPHLLEKYQREGVSLHLVYEDKKAYISDADNNLLHKQPFLSLFLRALDVS